MSRAIWGSLSLEEQIIWQARTSDDDGGERQGEDGIRLVL